MIDRLVTSRHKSLKGMLDQNHSWVSKTVRQNFYKNFEIYISTMDYLKNWYWIAPLKCCTQDFELRLMRGLLNGLEVYEWFLSL